MKKSELKRIIKEELSNMSQSQEISQLVKDLISIGYKKYQLGIEKDMGVYWITLPQNSMGKKEMERLANIIPDGCIVGYFPSLFSGLSIKTPIKL